MGNRHVIEDASDPVVEYQLDEDIFDGRREYYITTLDPRFESVDDIFRKLLSKRFGSEFEPIRVIPYRLTHLVEFRNYVFISDKLKRNSLSSDSVWIPENEELNEEICSSTFMDNLISGLGRQKYVFINTFTTSFFKATWKNVIPIGPKPKLATSLDSKVEQRKLLDTFDLSPEGTIVENLDELKNFLIDKVSKKWFVSTEYSSGGAESSIITEIVDIDRFARKIRERDRDHRFVISEYLEHRDSPNSTGIVLDKDLVFVASVSDQLFLDDLLRGTEYVGNIYPSQTTDAVKKQIIEATRALGLCLGRHGYRGFFGCDFVVNDNRVFAVDINPRRQGGLLCNTLMFEKLRNKGYPNLLALEMDAVLGESNEKSSLNRLENPKTGFIWSHYKIPPAGSNPTITREIAEGSERACFEQVGSRFVKSFFPKGSHFLGGDMVGLIMTTGLTYESLLNKTSRQASHFS